jgi:hypothetical protein
MENDLLVPQRDRRNMGEDEMGLMYEEEVINHLRIYWPHVVKVKWQDVAEILEYFGPSGLTSIDKGYEFDSSRRLAIWNIFPQSFRLLWFKAEADAIFAKMKWGQP